MARPIRFSEVNALEPLDSSRFKVEFPTIQGIDGQVLSLKHTEVSIPNRGIAQIGVKYLGNTTNFRGSSQNDNILTISFIETADAAITKAIFDWMKLVRNSENGTGKRKAEYAQPAKVYLFNSKGEVTITFNVYNMWPMQVTMPQLGDASGPVKYEVQFSIDAIGPEDSEPDSNANPLFTPSSLNTVGSNLQAGLGVGNKSTGIQLGAGANIGPFNLSLNANIPLPINALTLSQFTNKFANVFKLF